MGGCGLANMSKEQSTDQAATEAPAEQPAFPPEGKYDHYGQLTDTGWSEVRARIAAAAKDGSALDAQDLADLDKLLRGLEEQMNIRVMAFGYNFIVGKNGAVLGLTSGDHHYEEAKLSLDMVGWHAIDDSIDPKTMSEDATWLKAWRWCNQTRPEHYEVVVTKTPGGDMAYDWLEPGRHRDKGVGEHAYYANNLGEAQFWMPRETFERLAPDWAKAQVAPLNAEPQKPSAEAPA